MLTEDQGREKAVQIYKILATLLGLLGAGLLTCGIIAVDEEREEGDFGLPYYIGGFTAGIMTLAASALCTYIFLKAPDANNEIKKRELGSVIKGHYTLSMFTIIGCFIGCVSAAFSEFRTRGGYGEDEGSNSVKATLAQAILIGCIIAIFVTMSSLYVVSIYGPYFGVVIRSYRDRRIVVMNTGEMPSTLNATTFQINTQSNNEQMRQLEVQNRLLQQSLQQGQQQTQYGFYPHAPPPTYNESAFPKTPPR